MMDNYYAQKMYEQQFQEQDKKINKQINNIDVNKNIQPLKILQKALANANQPKKII